MSLTEQIYAQALVLTQDSTDVNQELLKMLCRSAENALRRLLRDGITPEDCRADFIAGASLMALAALSETDDLVTLIWANEPFDPDRPDTFGEKV